MMVMAIAILFGKKKVLCSLIDGPSERDDGQIN
jgi:hypothetical protein